MERLNYITADEWWMADVNIIKDLAAHYDLHVYVLSPSPKRCKYPRKDVEGCDIHNICYHFRKRNLLCVIFLLYFYLRVLIASLRGNAINFCVYGWHPILVPLFLYFFPRKNTILSVHNYVAHSHSKYDTTKYFYTRFHYFHFHSEIQMKLYKDDYKDGNAFYTSMFPHDFGKPKDIYHLNKNGKKLLLFFGLIRKYKRLDLLIEAVNKMDNQDFIVLIAGYAADFTEYENMIKNKEQFKCEIRMIDVGRFCCFAV